MIACAGRDGEVVTRRSEGVSVALDGGALISDERVPGDDNSAGS